MATITLPGHPFRAPFALSVVAAMMPATSTAEERNMVEQAVGPIVAAIAAQAPNGWSQAVLHSRAGRGGSSVTGGYTVRGEYRDTGMPNPYRELMALGEALRIDRG